MGNSIFFVATVACITSEDRALNYYDERLTGHAVLHTEIDVLVSCKQGPDA